MYVDQEVAPDEDKTSTNRPPTAGTDVSDHYLARRQEKDDR